MNLGFRIFGWVLTGPLLALLLSRWVYFDKHHLLIAANMFARYLYIPAWAISAAAWSLEDVPLGIGASVVCAWHLVFLWRDFGSVLTSKERATGKGPQVRVVAANLLMVNPQAAGLMQELVQEHADIYLFTEYSPRFEAQAKQLNLRESHPYGWERVQEDSFGVAVFSRFPLAREDEWELYGGAPIPRIIVQVPILKSGTCDNGEVIPLSILSVHTFPPRGSEYTSYHLRQNQELINEVKSAMKVDPRTRLLVAGDLNASPHNSIVLGLQDAGLRCAFRAVGRSHINTFPNGVFPLPPVRLDHALVSPSVRILDARVGKGLGSDHLPLVLDLELDA